MTSVGGTAHEDERAVADAILATRRKLLAMPLCDDSASEAKRMKEVLIDMGTLIAERLPLDDSIYADALWNAFQAATENTQSAQRLRWLREDVTGWGEMADELRIVATGEKPLSGGKPDRLVRIMMFEGAILMLAIAMLWVAETGRRRAVCWFP